MSELPQAKSRARCRRLLLAGLLPAVAAQPREPRGEAPAIGRLDTLLEALRQSEVSTQPDAPDRTAQFNNWMNFRNR